MRAIVTGGLGFVGSWLVEALKEAGDYVAVLDDMSRPVIEASASSADRVYSVSLQGGFMGHVDFSDWDIIWHLASPVGPASLKRGMNVCWQIVDDTRHVLDFADEHHAKVVLFSTPEVYGTKPAIGTFLDELHHLEVRLPYDVRREYPIGKIAAECMALNRVGVQVQVVRPYNVIGPRQSASGGFVIARFAEQLRQGKPLTIFYGGNQRRQFTSVHDVIRFCMMLRERWPKTNEIWNVANPQVWPICRVAQMMQKVWAHQSRTNGREMISLIESVDPQIELSNPDYRETEEKLVDVSKARHYGWVAKDSLDDVIRELLA